LLSSYTDKNTAFSLRLPTKSKLFDDIFQFSAQVAEKPPSHASCSCPNLGFEVLGGIADGNIAVEPVLKFIPLPYQE
jgi:hypothetical protein